MISHVQTPRINILGGSEVQYRQSKVLRSEPLFITQNQSGRHDKRVPLPGILEQNYVHHGPKQPFPANDHDQDA